MFPKQMVRGSNPFEDTKQRKDMNRGIIGSIFPNQLERIDNGQCPFCGEQVLDGDFKDMISREEFVISGLCQKCQDEVFNDD